MYLRHLSDFELGRCLNAVECNLQFTYDIDMPEDYYDLFFDLSEWIDIDKLKENKEIYNSMLKLATGIGYYSHVRKPKENEYVTRELIDIEKDSIVVYMLIRDEFRKRKIIPENIPFFKKPEIISDIRSVNLLGGVGTRYGIGGYKLDYTELDYPVRCAVKILQKKGYITYWSSGNIEDAISRRGAIIPDKNVAYILIDPSNFPDNNKDELINLLSLNDAKRLWGLAYQMYERDGKYYGIWAEITSPEMSADELSNVLAQRALALPSLTKLIREQNGHNLS